MKMNIVFVILVIVNSVHSITAENPVIVFNVQSNNENHKCTEAYPPIAVEGESTSINIYVNSSYNLTSGHVFGCLNNDFANPDLSFFIVPTEPEICYDGQAKQIRLRKIMNNNNTFLTEEQQVINDANKKWECHFYHHTNNAEKITILCNTRFHIRSKKPNALIYLNSNEITATRTSLDVREYDGQTSYNFEVDETVVINCKRTQRSGYATNMKYYNNAGRILFKALDSWEKDGKVESVLIKLTQECNSNYIDCYYTDNENQDVVTRILFKHQNVITINSVIRLYINGMYVRPTDAEYEHVYHVGEVTNITCYTNNVDHLLVLAFNGKRSEELSKVSKTLNLDGKYNNTNVECTAIDKPTRGLQYSVSVKLIPSSSDFYIIGLHKGNILQQYQKTGDSTVIYYQFIENEILTLNCSAPKPNANTLDWTFNDTSITSTKETKTRYLLLKLPLQASYDNSIIKCSLIPKHSHKIREIAIRLSYKMTSDIGEITSDIDSTLEYWIGGIITILITIIIIYNVRNYKNKWRKRQSSRTNLVNSNNSEDRPQQPMADEDNYTELVVSEIYNATDHRIHKTRTEKTSINVHYANCNSNTITGNVPNYANANDKTIDAANNSLIKFTDSNNYVNKSMIQGPSYVNSNFGEEPAEHIYCEVR